MFNLDALRRQLIAHEDIRLKPYRDTRGKLTIGVGRNLDDMGLTQGEVMSMLDHDIARCINELNDHLPWWRNMTDARQRALLDMCFNLGITRLKTFKKALAAMQEEDYDKAALEMLDSKWARQVKGRAVTLASMMRAGK